MATYKTRRGARNYGIAVGILQLDCSLPFIPGDVDNADTYDFPVIYKVVPGLSTKACLAGAPELARAVQDAVGLPVFDFVTMINHLHAATHRERYTGAY